ncbi:MAG: trigger factor [Acidobacteriales bacterium]|nr:trigger factor [Terriglobales bacterium]
MTTSVETPTSQEEQQEQQTAATRSECEREIKAEIPANIVSRETDTVVQKYQKLARIPGFRKGKVPASLIRKQFASEVKQEVIEKLIPQALRAETEKQGLRPISQPRITDLHAHEGEPLKFTAMFEVCPEVKLPEYKNLGVHKPQVDVSDDEVNKEIEALRERQANYDAVEEERALEDGDFASITFEGSPKRAEGEEPTGQPAKMEDVLVEIGGANTVQEFTENLRGAKSGDERTFDVSYPQDFSEPKLAGQTITYKVTVNGIKKKVLPELNDDFAKELGPFESFEDFKSKLRQNMLDQKQQAAESEAKDKIVEQLIAQSNFPVPEVLVDQQIELRLNRGLQALAQQGMRETDMRKLDFQRLRGGQREGAVREVKAAMILDKIADQENISVTDEELENEIQHLSAHTGENFQTLHARLERDGSLERIRERMRNEKTLNQLLA